MQSVFLVSLNGPGISLHLLKFVYRPSFMLVPCFCRSSAVCLVRSCSSRMAASFASPGDMRSALMASSLLDASSGFQWFRPSFCFLSWSCLCFSNSSGLGSSTKRVLGYVVMFDMGVIVGYVMMGSRSMASKTVEDGGGGVRTA